VFAVSGDPVGLGLVASPQQAQRKPHRLCFAAGYLFAASLSGARDTTPLARICSRVDYVNGLQEELEGQ
jgi:hypothetical protein